MVEMEVESSEEDDDDEDDDDDEEDEDDDELKTGSATRPPDNSQMQVGARG